MGRDTQSYRSLGSPRTHNTFSPYFIPLHPHCHSFSLPHTVTCLTMSPLPFFPTTFSPSLVSEIAQLILSYRLGKQLTLNRYLQSAAPLPQVITEDGHSDKLFNLILRWIFGFLSPYFFQYPCFLLESRVSLEDTREGAFIQLALIVTRYTKDITNPILVLT